jgi:flagellar hook-associated protein 1 FlgK
MSSLFGMMYTGVSGIYAAQVQMDVTGQNLANINNENYSRQRVNLVSASVMEDRAGAFGRGVKVEEVIRVYDELMATTLRKENADLSYWSNHQTTVKEMMLHFNELEDGSGLGLALQKYFDSWQALHADPPDNTDDSYVRRTELLENAKQLASQMNVGRQSLVDLQVKIDTNIKLAVDDINSMSKSILELNRKIALVEAGGMQNANDLRDNRDALLDKLAKYAQITVHEKPNGEMSVYMGGEPLVDNGTVFELGVVANQDTSGMYDIVWNSGTFGAKPTVINEQLKAGTLQSNLQLRDELIDKYIDELDELAAMLIQETNKVHVSGQGLERFSSLTASNRVENPAYLLDRTPGVFPFDVKSGAFQIKIYDEAGDLMDTYNVTIDPATDTLNGIAEKISRAVGTNSGGLAKAGVNGDNKLVINVPTGYTFAFGDDTSNFLMAAGFNNFFEGTDASNIGVDVHIRENPQYIAASKSGAPGDNEAAKAMNDVQFAKVVEGKISISEFYGFYVGQMALDKQQIDVFTNTKQMVVDNYTAQMSNMRHPNKDDETLNLSFFQRIFEANSRYVNAVDAMIDTIVNNLGLVGR